MHRVPSGSAAEGVMRPRTVAGAARDDYGEECDTEKPNNQRTQKTKKDQRSNGKSSKGVQWRHDAKAHFGLWSL
jgi:hypothetical protein